MGDWDWTRIVFDHLHIRVRDALASVTFYRALLSSPLPPAWPTSSAATASG